MVSQQTLTGFSKKEESSRMESRKLSLSESSDYSESSTTSSEYQVGAVDIYLPVEIAKIKSKRNTPNHEIHISRESCFI